MCYIDSFFPTEMAEPAELIYKESVELINDKKYFMNELKRVDEENQKLRDELDILRDEIKQLSMGV